MYRLAFQGRHAARPPRLVREPRLLIGRASDCQLQLGDEGILEHHAIIERREDGYHVSPVAETAATRVNGQQVRDYRLRHGDVVEIGPVSLRFEVPVPALVPRHRTDWLLVLTSLGVLLVVLGQVVVVVWVLRQPRFLAPALVPAAVEPEETVPAPPASVPVVSEPVPPAPVPVRPSILTRQLRIDQITVLQQGNELAVRIQLRIQVADREVDRAAAAVGVQFFFRGRNGTVSPWAHPVWLNLGEMQNFSSKILHARFPGLAEQYGGCVVRTFYRQELQDEAALPADLLPLAPLIMPSP
ncbi:MAG: FHA domain-containing protein [Verrucomicrobiae bacterium]|nr:FHA domain-containing protein [Verrucomicrobiae bacterium]